jgi:hypothetical protein
MMPPVRWGRAAPDRREILLYPFYRTRERGDNGKAIRQRVYFQDGFTSRSLPMPLRDHFHGELNQRRHWESFLACWPMEIIRRLNTRLPARYRGELQVHLGLGVEPDVVAFEEESLSENARPVQTYAVDLPAQDAFEVRIVDDQHGRLVAAIELVSPGNKDRPENRRAFAIKCAAYLQQRVSVVIVDMVTERRANLHLELMELLQQREAAPWTEGQDLYAVAYRTTKENDAWRLDIWQQPLALGQPLPTLPLWLASNLAVPLELEVNYEETCQVLRIR